MTKRRFTKPHDRGDIFGVWISITALTASKTYPLPDAARRVVLSRVHLSLEDVVKAPEPTVNSWRDLTDAMNFIQSAVEKGWAMDHDGAIDAAKAALLGSAQAFERHGKVRMTGPELGGIRNCIEQFDAIVNEISAHSYWQLVAHTQNRIRRVQRGAKRRGDTVVSL